MAITAAMVKELREKTGSGMMDCKKALTEHDGDVDKAIEYLRKKGIASASKRQEKATKEGVVASYIHPGDRLGVLVEVNCETDFVAKTDDFRNFVKDICMQIAGANPLVVERGELSADDIENEKKIYREQARNEGKPEKILDKIVDGKIEKYYKEVCLIDQTFIKDQDKDIKTVLDELRGKIGENISIRRFSRMQLGA